MAQLYPGKIPSNVNRDAKYSIVSGPDRMRIRLIYQIKAGVRELLTTDRHDDLVNMVNDVKTEVTGTPGGSFYINEYWDVLVPTAANGCFYAGNYPNNLEFDFEGTILGPRPPVGLVPGDLWVGPHPGIAYVLTAGRTDFKYKRMISPTREETVRLSDQIGQVAAESIARRLGQPRGTGGRVYINEAGAFFTRVKRGDEWIYIFLGSLDDDGWFDAPDVPRFGD